MQNLLGQFEESEPTPPSDIAAALTRINDQLAIQNRRRARIWKIVALVLGLYVAFNMLLLVLGYAVYTGEVEVQVVIAEESMLTE